MTARSGPIPVPSPHRHGSRFDACPLPQDGRSARHGKSPVSGPRSTFREVAARRLAEDRGIPSPALDDFLSDIGRLSVRQLPVDLIQVHSAREEELKDSAFFETLVASVRELGVLEPILVRPVADGQYEVIAGERRLRAAMVAGLDTIAAVVREMDDATAVTLMAARSELPRDVAPPAAAVSPRRNAVASAQESAAGTVTRPAAVSLRKGRPLLLLGPMILRRLVRGRGTGRSR